MAKRSLILCLAAHYSLKKMEPFLCSWQEHMPSTRLAMLSADNEPGFQDISARLGVETIDAERGLSRPFHPQTARYFMYRDFLMKSLEQFDSVLLTDVRDVIFQSDVFAVERDSPVWFAAEPQMIGGCVTNTHWISSAYGPGMARTLADKQISCSGTTLGSMDGIISYLDLICNEAERHPSVAAMIGVDQGFHNFILWVLRPHFIKLDTRDRVAATLCHIRSEDIAVELGRVRVMDHCPPIVHQWDRRPHIKDFIQDRYSWDDLKISQV